MTQLPGQPLSEQSDQNLVRAYQDGRKDAFALLIQRYQEELFHFLLRFVGSRTAAEDIFQEAFLQVHLAIHTFDTDRPFKPWLFTIAANKARDYLRRNRRNSNTLALSAPTDDQDDGSLSFVDLMDGQLPTPDENAANQETRQLVQDVVASLPDHLRQILVMAYFHQVPYKDIAKAMGIPLGTVKSRLHAAVGTFAQAWRQNNPGASRANGKPGDPNARNNSDTV